jgi:formylmethanofuran dehydrogenase subunit E
MKGQQQNRFRPKKGANYVRCPRCGGEFIDEKMRLEDGKLICGPCYLIDRVWKQ